MTPHHAAAQEPATIPHQSGPTQRQSPLPPSQTEDVSTGPQNSDTSGLSRAEAQVGTAAQHANTETGRGQNGLSVALEALNRVAERLNRGETVTQQLLDDVAAEAAQPTGATDTEARARAAAQAYRDTRILLAPVDRIKDVAANWSGQEDSPTVATPLPGMQSFAALDAQQMASLQQQVNRLFERYAA